MKWITDLVCPNCGNPLYGTCQADDNDPETFTSRYECEHCFYTVEANSANEAQRIIDTFRKPKLPNIPTLCKDDFEEEQKAKSDYGKAKLTLVPTRITWDIAAVREYGNNKYPDGGPNNWKKVDAQRYRDAAYRHFLRYIENPYGCDPESKLPHLWHLACNIAFLCEIQDTDKGKYKDKYLEEGLL